MPPVADRLVNAPACAVINLDDAERDLYSGSGWKLARFEAGRLVEFFDPQQVQYQQDTQAMADEAVSQALTWLRGATGEVWLVMCSGYQLCEPRRVTPTDAPALARMTRVFGDQFTDSE